jgi:hypothetical protein
LVPPSSCPYTLQSRSPACPERRILLIGYVSDEKYVALPDVLLEFVAPDGDSREARSRASGAVHAEVPAGDYRVALHKPGFGARSVRLTLPTSQAQVAVRETSLPDPRGQGYVSRLFSLRAG